MPRDESRKNELAKGASRRRVALLIETSNSYARGLLHGIRAYMREGRPWSIRLGEHRRGESAPWELREWEGDGIIARIENDAIAHAVQRLGLPAIDVSAARALPNLPFVETDDAAIAELAAKHLLERGFRHLAFAGDPRFNWSRWRCDRFCAIVRDNGLEPAVWPSSPKGRTQNSLEAWIRGLPKPVGIMAAYDIQGREVLDCCRGLGIAVPEEVAVIGVDNDELVCDLADPPLSSVTPDAWGAGYEAARLLDEMMDGKKIPPTAHLVKPMGIATRDSTDVLATDDREVAAAVRYIRMNAQAGINVDDVVRTSSLSRRVLEARFAKLLGRTPHDEILRVRLERAKQLLAETELPLAAIALRVGYEHPEYLSVVFKRQTGMTPSDYRATVQSPAHASPRQRRSVIRR